MRIGGFQSLTLLDFPGKVAAIVFTQGCPFACSYCHNPELIPTQQGAHTEEDILSKIEERKDFLDGVVVTGGEPTVQPDLMRFLKKIKALSLLVKLDTNGVHPDMIEQCVQEGVVDFFAMDIKHQFGKYKEVIGEVPDRVLENCERTMKIITHSGVSYEFRTTTNAEIHTQEDILAIASRLPIGTRYALQGMRTQKTLKPMYATGEYTTYFLSECQRRILEARPDLHLILRA
jgi:pyruvate formate lyase activating enzyme